MREFGWNGFNCKKIYPAGSWLFCASTLWSFNIKTFIWTGSCKHLDKCNFSLSGRTYFSNHLIFHLVSFSRSQSILFSHANMVIIQLIHRRGERFAYRFSWWMLRLCYQGREKEKHTDIMCMHTYRNTFLKNLSQTYNVHLLAKECTNMQNIVCTVNTTYAVYTVCLNLHVAEM